MARWRSRWSGQLTVSRLPIAWCFTIWPNTPWIGIGSGLKTAARRGTCSGAYTIRDIYNSVKIRLTCGGKGYNCVRPLWGPLDFTWVVQDTGACGVIRARILDV